jgi:glycosyltransferase 2 family protein
MGDSKSLAKLAKLGSSWLTKEKIFSLKLRNLLLYTIIFAFVAWCFIAFRADIAHISLEPIWQARNAVFFAALLSLINYFFRIIRWSAYLNRFGFRFPATFTCLTYVAGFAFTLSPGKVGEMVRARYYKEAGVPLAVTTAAFFIERLMDMLAMASMALIGFAVSSGYSLALWICLGSMLVLLAVLGVTPWERSQAWLMRHQHIPATLRNAFAGVLRIMISARSLLSPRLLAFGFFLGLFAWGAEGLGLMVLGSLGPSVQIDWATASGIYAVAVLIGALSFLPGGLGTTEVVMATLLAAHGYAMPQAILLTMVCRILTLWLAVILGWGAVLVLHHYPEQVSIKS